MADALPLDLPVLVGGYTADLSGRALGILTLPPAAGSGATPDVQHLQPVPSPSYLVRHPDRPWLFAVSESSPGRVFSFAVDRTGRLSPLGHADTGSDASCHLALAPHGQLLVSASYGSGSVSSFGVRPDGSLGPRLDLLSFTGHGRDPERQKQSHAHQVVWLDGELLVCDLGTDQVHRLLVDRSGRFSAAAPPILVPAGTGPRHLVRCGGHLVVVGELSAEVLLLRPSAPGWAVADVVPSSATSGSAPSGVVAQGNRVFVANRGPDTVAVLDVDPAAGRLRSVTEFSCGGWTPRDLTLSRGRLWVANQDSDRVSVFRTASMPAARLELELSAPSPTCLLPWETPPPG